MPAVSHLPPLPEKRVLAVSGLRQETSIADRAGATSVAGGGQVALLRRRLEAIDAERVGGVVSFGLAGALSPDLRVGTLLLATAVVDGKTRRPVSPELLEACRDALRRRQTAWREITLVGVDRPVMDRDGKSSLALASGAAAVDMESHVAGEWAQERQLPFAVVRVVSDAAGTTLPPLAASAMKPDGSIDLLHVARELIRAPGQIPALIATGRDAGTAFRALRGVGGLLGELVR